MENKIELAKLFDLFAADPAYNEDIAAMTVNELCKKCTEALGIAQDSEAEDTLIQCIQDVQKAAFIAGFAFAKRLG